MPIKYTYNTLIEEYQRQIAKLREFYQLGLLRGRQSAMLCKVFGDDFNTRWYLSGTDRVPPIDQYGYRVALTGLEMLAFRLGATQGLKT